MPSRKEELIVFIVNANIRSLIGLHAVQFGNNWMEKNSKDSQNCQRNFLNSIISKLDKLVVLLFINYIVG